MSAPVRELVTAPAPVPLAARGRVGEVLDLAWPVVLQSMAETTMQVIDSAMVGRLGATELGAIGFASVWVWTLYSPLTGTATGVQTFVSREDGARTQERCGVWAWQALWLLVPAALIWTLLLVLALPALFAAIGPSPALLESARVYVFARLPGAPAMVAAIVLTSFFRGIGDTRIPLLAALLAVMANVVVAYGCIFGELGFPRLGIIGAGLGMSVGAWVMLGVLLVYFLRGALRERYRTGFAAPHGADIRRFRRTSAPIGGQWLLDMLTFALFTSIVARMGDAPMAASQAMLQLLSLSFMQAVAIGIATGTLVGRYLGADDPESSGRSYRSGQTLALVLAAAVAVLFLSVPEVMVGIFSRDEAVLALARPLLALGAFFQVLDAVGIVAGHALRGAGDTRWPFAVQASLAWVLRLPAVWVGAIWLQGGVFGAWAGELVYVAGLSLAFLARFRSGHWRTVRL
jgi:MATE family multidrug resistance protein